jgi:tRNA(adenine34) deaminase
MNATGYTPLSLEKMPQDKKDTYFMQEAIKEAKKAYSEDEVPVGAVLVFDNRIIARGHNQIEMLKDATAHAEMICLTSGSAHFGNWRLSDTTLYCTLEPCCMCAGAMFASRIKRLVWGARDLRVGVNGSWIDVFKKDHPMHSIEIKTNVLADQSAYLMKKFFEKKRSAKKALVDVLQG